MGEPVRLEIEGDGPAAVAVVTLDAPPLNIYDLAMRDGLIEAIGAVADIDDVDPIAAMILRSEGEHFSAGADLAEFGTAESIFEGRRIRWDRDPWLPLLGLPMPTVAVLRGVAVGSGLEMALLCDIRIAGPTARVALPETKLGMLPAAGGTQSLTRAIGPGAAVPVVALAETYDARAAAHRGLVTELADDPDGLALELARRFGGQDRAALRAVKRAVQSALDLPLADGLALERRLAAVVAGADGHSR